MMNRLNYVMLVIHLRVIILSLQSVSTMLSNTLGNNSIRLSTLINHQHSNNNSNNNNKLIFNRKTDFYLIYLNIYLYIYIN